MIGQDKPDPVVPDDADAQRVAAAKAAAVESLKLARAYLDAARESPNVGGIAPRPIGVG
jgi:hypothetical protein